MNVITFTFSGTGNTRWVSQRLGETLQEHGYQARTVAVETADMASILKAAETPDAVGFAYPLYGADIPRIMRRCIRQFLDAAQANPSIPRTLFFINTFAYVNGSGVFEARKLLRHTPFLIKYYINIPMINSAPGKRSDNPNSRAAADAKRKRSAARKLEKFVSRLESGRPRIEGVGPQLLAGKLVRALLRRPIANNYTHMRVDLQACTRCMQCVRGCPARCIQFADGKFTFTKDCEACMRCCRGCPAHVITNG